MTILRPDSEVGQELNLARNIKLSFSQIFQRSGQAGQTVLKELMFFCHALKTTATYDNQGRIDPNATLILEGRRQVWNMIEQRLGLTTEELYALTRTK